MGKLTATRIKNIKLDDEIERVIERQKRKALEKGEEYSPKRRPTEVKLSDGGGLYLLAKSSGLYWRFNYRFPGNGRVQAKTLALGVYPAVSLREARERHREAQKLLEGGVDPGEHRKRLREARLTASENTFQALTHQFLTKQNWSDSHRKTVESRLRRDVLPTIGSKPIADVEPGDILAICRKVEGRGAIETAHRIRTVIGQVMRFAVALGLAKSDPTRDLKGALTPIQPKHMAAIVDPKEVGGLMRAVQDYQGSSIVRAALKLAALTFVRPGELRRAEWSEIDSDRQLWIIPPERMKSRQKHLVPLSRQAVDVLEELQPITGEGRYIFPSGHAKGRPMSENAVLTALRRMGYTKEEMTGHGFRSMASTNLYELGWRSELVETQLAHKDRNVVRAAYNHAEYIDERREMMQSWSDYLDDLREGGKVIPIRKRSNG